MRSMRPVSTIIWVGLWLGGLPACSSVLLNTPVAKSADGWRVTLGHAKEGPNEYVGEGVAVNPGSGEELIWTLVTVRNEGAQEETFSYDTCALEGKDEARRPVMVDRNTGVNAPADRSEALNPGQEHTRLLIYSYPKDERPTRMRCGKIVLPIPAPR
jgi:hypothetical protein